MNIENKIKELERKICCNTNGMYLFQVGIVYSGHIHYAVLSQKDAQDLVHKTDSAIPVADPLQPNVIIKTEKNGEAGDEHTHNLTVYFDYQKHTFIVTNISNNSQYNHSAFLIGGNDWIGNGTYYISVNAIGTPQQNGIELFNKYQEALYIRSVGIAPVTILISPGIYYIDSTMIIDTNNITLTSINGERNVNILSNIYIESGSESINMIGIEAFNINFGNISSCVFKNCKSASSYSFGNLDSLQVGDLLFENCEALNYSFLSTAEHLTCNNIIFKNCNGGSNCFIYSNNLINASNVIIDSCKSLDNSFFNSLNGPTGANVNGVIKNSIAFDQSFFTRVTVTSGTIENCNGGVNCISGSDISNFNIYNYKGGTILGNIVLANEISVYNTVADFSTVSDLQRIYVYFSKSLNNNFPTFTDVVTRYCLNANDTADNQN